MDDDKRWQEVLQRPGSDEVLEMLAEEALSEYGNEGKAIRIFYDCEFIDDGHTIDLISIGLVTEDGHELYMQSTEFNAGHASDWVLKNVLGNIKICPSGSMQQHRKGHISCDDDACPWYNRDVMRHYLYEFFLDASLRSNSELELWGYYSAYDHVALAQIFGAMIDLPKFVPMYTHDLKQWCDALGNPKLPEQTGEKHNALADAKWNKEVWDFLYRVEGSLKYTVGPVKHEE